MYGIPTVTRFILQISRACCPSAQPSDRSENAARKSKIFSVKCAFSSHGALCIVRGLSQEQRLKPE
nr:MAG TPA: hypothetical protein [Caudoviricetes sp.]